MDLDLAASRRTSARRPLVRHPGHCRGIAGHPDPVALTFAHYGPDAALLSNGGVEEFWDVYFVIDRFLLDFSEPWATPFPPEARVSCDTVAGAKFRTPSTCSRTALAIPTGQRSRNGPEPSAWTWTRSTKVSGSDPASTGSERTSSRYLLHRERVGVRVVLLGAPELDQ